MSTAVEAAKVADAPVADAVTPTPAPVVEPVVADKDVTPAAEAPETEEIKTETDAAAAAPVEEKVEAKVAEPIYSGALGYKAPGLKNAFRFSKKYFWFGEEPVPAANLREYLRGEKPEVAHSVAAWSSVTGKGLLYFVKHADQKEHPAGVLNLAYATDLHKDGPIAFAMKISGSKHVFEAATGAERDGWFVAVEKALTEAKASKEGIESGDDYKEHKEKIGKPTTLAAATASASTPKKSTDATPKAAETETPAVEETAAVVPTRTGSSSGSSADEEKKAKKAKSKSRSASRKRASIFGGLLGKKDKADDKKDEPKVEGESSKAAAEVKKDDATPIADSSTTAPVITTDIPKASEEVKTDATLAPIVVPTAEDSKTGESTTKTADEKPKPTKRGSIFGSFFEKVKSPTSEKKESDIVPAPLAKDSEPTVEASKPLDEAVVAAPATTETAPEPAALKTDEAKPVETKPAVSTPSKEKEHFSFGKLFGSKDRAKSPAATDKIPEVTKVDAIAPKIEDTTAPVVSEPAESAAAPVADSKVEPTVADKETTPVKKEKRSSIFGSLGRSLSKATKSKDKKDTTVAPTTVPETTEPKDETAVAPVDDKKDETPVVAAPAEKSIGDVVPEAVTVGEAPKSSSAGCCISRPEADGPNEAIRANSSSRNITAPSTRPGSIPSPRGSHASQGNVHASSSRLDPVDRPNTPLKAIPMFQRSRLPNSLASPTGTGRGRIMPLTDSTNITWTRSRLEKERNDWWDTQVAGSQEVWGAIRLAAQSLQAGKIRDAQQWLETMECTCPSGCLWKGVYDSTGVMYKLPEWLIVEPDGLVAEEGSDEEAAATGVGGAEELAHDDDEEDDEPELVRVRISRNGRDVLIKARRKEHVASIIDKIKKQAELEPSLKIRLVYGGRVYHDNEILESHPFWDFANDFIINALVLE
ncbi:Pleckstrin homology domain-containing protein [Phaeosphaeriaceae sp. PMI808]|nr:Pleckstrin homology domain-containing protein [Phaeosphaeriaceae sp. PMI808]